MVLAASGQLLRTCLLGEDREGIYGKSEKHLPLALLLSSEEHSCHPGTHTSDLHKPE